MLRFLLVTRDFHAWVFGSHLRHRPLPFLDRKAACGLAVQFNLAGIKNWLVVGTTFLTGCGAGVA
jgi:hypothetical protein